MNNLFYTLAEINLYIAAFAVLYFLFLKNQPNHRLNRGVILGSVAISFSLPFVAVPASAEVIANAVLPQIEVGGKSIQAISGGSMGVLPILLLVYIGGVAYRLAGLGFDIFKIRQMRRNFVREEIRSGVHVYSGPEIKSTSSYFNAIFCAHEGTTREEQELIIQHEMVHVRENHSADLLLLRIVTAFCWFNPAIYYFEKALKSTHEFRADEVVSAGVTNKAAYGELLISSAFGIDPILLTNQFSNSKLLKKRITMLYKNNANRASFARYFLLVSVGVLAVFIQSCTKENPNDKIIEEDVIEIEKEKVHSSFDEESGVYRITEEMPEFKGGNDALMTYLANNIVYPDECRDLEMEGLVYVAFTIDETGKVGDIEVVRSPDSRMSAAAVEAVSNMPDWEPGKQKGQKVKVRYNLPIKFKLS